MCSRGGPLTLAAAVSDIGAVLPGENAMGYYAEELRIITDAILNIVFDDGDGRRRNAALKGLAKAITAETFPESIKGLCQQALGTWALSEDVGDSKDKSTLQRSAMASLLIAYGRLNGFAATEDYINQRNTQELGLR